MRSFIFLTYEGHTFQPDSESIEPDIDNLQVLGFGCGKNSEEAFQNFINENDWIRQTTFREIVGIELKEEDYHKHMSFREIPAGNE